MKPWREIAIPHTDVLKGTFQQAEFAADITAVHSGRAPVEYRDPVAFFERTYITEGMRPLLTQVIQRLSGKGGEPVIQLQAAFGGGKTHTMLAVLHLASRKSPLSDLLGIPTLVEKAGLMDVPQVKLVPTAIVLASLPESGPRNARNNVQVGGESGLLALRSLEDVFGRVHARSRSCGGGCSNRSRTSRRATRSAGRLPTRMLPRGPSCRARRGRGRSMRRDKRQVPDTGLKLPDVPGVMSVRRIGVHCRGAGGHGSTKRFGRCQLLPRFSMRPSSLLRGERLSVRQSATARCYSREESGRGHLAAMRFRGSPAVFEAIRLAKAPRL
jgi:hypothetical protein